MNPTNRPGLQRFAPTVAIAASFLLNAAVRAPVPGPNEPHYLTKARHFWDADWCPGDFFLDSADAHWVFYAVFGPLTAVLPFTLAAWAGRLLAHGLLAFGWNELLSRVVPGRWTPVWAAWLYLGLAAIGNFSGEWVVGGVEAKVFGFGFAFLAVAWTIDRRWWWAAAALGLATAWHPLVGGWTGIAVLCGALGATTWRLAGRGRRDPLEPGAGALEAADRPLELAPATAIGGLLLCIACALPGLWPAYRLSAVPDTRDPRAPWTHPVDDLRFAADFIQVEHRLAHHLDPMTFGHHPDPARRRWLVWPCHLLLLLGWLLLRTRAPSVRGEREFAWFVGGTLVLVAIGLAIGFRTRPLRELPYDAIAWRVSLLKYYWFRLADILLPMAFAATVAGLAARRWPATPRRTWLPFGLVFLATLARPGAAGVATDLTTEEQRQWREVCAWARENTPPGTRFRTPHSGIAFKWYAERPEFLTGKDCPQDPGGIVEWNERSNWFEEWAREQYADSRYDEEEIRAVSRAMDVDYFIAWHLGPVDMEPVFEVGDYRVFDVREAE